jgi:DNA-binding LacI/PurR family transcriptional regulator
MWEWRMQDKYLYEMIYHTLREEIENKTYDHGSLLPSENQLCKRFSVERTTVRKALELLVKDKMVEKKPGVGSRVNYNPSGNGLQNIAMGDAIAFFILESETDNKKITEPYYADLFYFLDRECTSLGIQLIYSAITTYSNIVEILSKRDFIAAVFVTRIPHELIEQAKSCGTPILIVNDIHSKLPCVQHDYLNGSYKALAYLHKMGHERIAVITGPSGFMANDEKITGCYKAMLKFKIHIKDDWFVPGDWTFEGGYTAIKKLFERREQHPTAIYAFNDITAVGAIRALRELDLSVPQDVSMNLA